MFIKYTLFNAESKQNANEFDKEEFCPVEEIGEFSHIYVDTDTHRPVIMLKGNLDSIMLNLYVPDNKALYTKLITALYNKISANAPIVTLTGVCIDVNKDTDNTDEILSWLKEIEDENYSIF